MGGIGSGRYLFNNSNDTTFDYRSIDVRRWKKDELLRPNQDFNWNWSRDGKSVASIQVHTQVNAVILTYRHRSSGGSWKNESYPVTLDWTDCNFGGQRPWFLCPAKGCRRRVAILYGGGIFACRHCHRLAYPSQREPDYERSGRRADKIRERLDWEPGFLNGEGLRPKGMQKRTFERLRAEHNEHVTKSLAGVKSR